VDTLRPRRGVARAKTTEATFLQMPDIESGGGHGRRGVAVEVASAGNYPPSRSHRVLNAPKGSGRANVFENDDFRARV